MIALRLVRCGSGVIFQLPSYSAHNGRERQKVSLGPFHKGANPMYGGFVS